MSVDVEGLPAADIETLKQKAHSFIITVKVRLQLKQPFYGHLITDMEAVEASQWCKSASTDGLRFYYNWVYVLGLTEPQLEFLLKHELLHILNNHIGRMGNREHRIYNAACDYLINYELIEEMNVGLDKKHPTLLPPYGDFDIRFSPHDMGVEELYEYLKENENTFNIPEPMDEHFNEIAPSDGDASGQSSSIDVTVTGQNGKPTITQADIDSFQQVARDALLQAAMMAEQQKYSVPDSVRHLITKLIDPVMDWRSLLDAHVRSQLRSKRSFLRPSRRSVSLYAHTGKYFAFSRSDFDRTIRLHVALDVSGSMTPEQLRDLLSEIVGIAKSFPACEITLFCFDDFVFNDEHYTAEKLDTIENYELPEKGRGTNFSSIWAYLKQNDIRPERLVVFTDGKPNGLSWGDPFYCDTLFIIHSDQRQVIKPPFGQVAYYTKPLAAVA